MGGAEWGAARGGTNSRQQQQQLTHSSAVCEFRSRRRVFATDRTRLLLMSRNSFNGDKLSRSHNTSAVVAAIREKIRNPPGSWAG